MNEFYEISEDGRRHLNPDKLRKAQAELDEIWCILTELPTEHAEAKRVQYELEMVQTRLDEHQSDLIAHYEKENVGEAGQRKRKEEIASIQWIMKDMEKDYSELLLSGQNSDMTIEVKDKKFNCHRCILGARSFVFAAMMEHDMKEKASGVVTITDAEPTAFQDFLLYLYSGNDALVDSKNITDLYKLADKYAVEDLKNLCLEHIKQNIAMENFYKYFNLSQIHNDSQLTETTVQFFLKMSKEIVRSENWKMFMAENLDECNVLISALVDKYQSYCMLFSNMLVP